MPQPRPSFIVKRSTAVKAMLRHQFVPGLGYVAHEGEPELGPEYNGKANCAPAPQTATDTLHLLRPPGGHPPMTMRWVAKESAWAPTVQGKGNRLAWSHGYLSRAGWEYIGPFKG